MTDKAYLISVDNCTAIKASAFNMRYYCQPYLFLSIWQVEYLNISLPKAGLLHVISLCASFCMYGPTYLRGILVVTILLGLSARDVTTRSTSAKTAAQQALRRKSERTFDIRSSSSGDNNLGTCRGRASTNSTTHPDLSHSTKREG